MDAIPEASKIVINTVENTIGSIIEPIPTIIENIIDIVITPIPKIIDATIETVVKPLPNTVKKVNKLVRRNSGTFSQKDLHKDGGNEKHSHRSHSEPPQKKSIF